MWYISPFSFMISRGCCPRTGTIVAQRQSTSSRVRRSPSCLQIRAGHNTEQAEPYHPHSAQYLSRCFVIQRRARQYWHRINWSNRFFYFREMKDWYNDINFHVKPSWVSRYDLLRDQTEGHKTPNKIFQADCWSFESRGSFPCSFPFRESIISLIHWRLFLTNPMMFGWGAQSSNSLSWL